MKTLNENAMTSAGTEIARQGLGQRKRVVGNLRKCTGKIVYFIFDALARLFENGVVLGWENFTLSTILANFGSLLCDVRVVLEFSKNLEDA